MKKIIALVLALCLVFCIGCSKRAEASAPEGFTAVEDLEALNAVNGSRIAEPTVVQAAEAVCSYGTVGETPVSEYCFVADGVVCRLRFTPDFTATLFENVPMPDDTSEAIVTGEDGKYSRWLTVDGQYVLCVEDSEAEFFDTMEEEMHNATIAEDAG